MALLPPAALGAIALLLLRNNTSTVRGVLGFLTAVLAAPGLLVGGAPMTGGTGLYLRALCTGLFPGPTADATFRSRSSDSCGVLIL